MAEVYNHKVVEKKWQKVWDDEKAFAATNDYSKPKYYALVEFPYPSGQGLHVGHPRPYTAAEQQNAGQEPGDQVHGANSDPTGGGAGQPQTDN